MKVPVPAVVKPAAELRRVHFVGIGGTGLSGIARIMLVRGIQVTGSDAAESETLAQLRELGARCFARHAADQLGDVDVVVVSTAIPEDNPEVREAQRRGVPVWPRAAALVSVMTGREVLAVAGTHGKTTTTGMLASALLSAGEDPSYAIGADLAATGSNAHDGSGSTFVVEADESDGAFLSYSPMGAVVTNVDADHLDHYGSVAAYRAAFAAFLDTIRPGGFLVACTDDHGAAALADRARAVGVETVTVGLADDARLRAVEVSIGGGGSTSTVTLDGASVGTLRLQVPGRHYVRDALAALAAGLQLGHRAGDLLPGLAGYTGSRRRMERKGEAGGVQVYDSYAHHPVEIAADVEAARSLIGGGRLVVCFQPHLVSRTKTFAPQMGHALGAADVVVVTDVYAAREEPEEAVTGARVAVEVPLPADRVRHVPALGDVAPALLTLTRPGDLVLTLGAGDVTTVGPQLLELLGERAESRRG